MESTHIYALCEPETGEIRYIGKADNPQARLEIHLKDQSSSPKARWIRKLATGGKIPLLKILNRIPRWDWESWEKSYLAVGRDLGIRLLNLTEGGDGSRGLKWTVEQKKKHSERLAGKTFSLQHRENLRQARLGMKFSAEHREKISQGKRGTKYPPRSEAHRQKIREAHLGKKHSAFSAEARLNMSLARFRGWEKIRIQNVLLELWR